MGCEIFYHFKYFSIIKHDQVLLLSYCTGVEYKTSLEGQSSWKEPPDQADWLRKFKGSFEICKFQYHW